MSNVRPHKVTETEVNIRESLLSTLSFLASPTQQAAFAAKVPYASYEGEFACWWFDTFFPEAPNARAMFTAEQLAELVAFSELFNHSLKVLLAETRSFEALQTHSEWKAVVAAAQRAHSVVTATASL